MPLRTLMPLVLGASALTVVAAGTISQAHVPYATGADGLRCEIVTRDLGHMVEITGKVTARQATDGTYAIKIRQDAGGNRALIDQSGDFSVGQGRTVTLSETALGGRARDYRVELVVTTDGQRLYCTADGHTHDI